MFIAFKLWRDGWRKGRGTSLVRILGGNCPPEIWVWGRRWIFYHNLKFHRLRCIIHSAVAYMFIVSSSCASCEQLRSCGEQLQSCGEQLQNCGEPFQSCGEQLPSCGEPLQSCGEPLQSCGEQLQSCGEQLQSCGEPLQSCGEQLQSCGARRTFF